MKASGARSSLRKSRRILGVGAGVVLVTLATGARGPGTGSIEAFAKPPSRIPITETVVPDVATTSDLAVARPVPSQSSSALAVEAVGWSEIPAPALRAYRSAGLVMQRTAPSCGLTWEILAGIGRVESDHGRFGGAVVAPDGTSTPQIYGVALNGVGDVAAITDSDNGAVDSDTVWDRAVGPMQFLPTTWDVVGVDADGDGIQNPHDLDDAALAAAVYLCAGDVDMRDRAQLREALYRYNPSTEYVDLVLSYIDAYRNGEPVPITVTPPVDQVPPLDEPAESPVHPPTSQPEQQPDGTSPPSNGPGGSDGPGGGPQTGGSNGGDNSGDGGTGGGGTVDGGTGGGGGGGSGGGGNGGGGNGGGGEDPDEPPPPELAGVLSYDDQSDVWRISGHDVELDFGDEATLQQTSSTDYDGDQKPPESVEDELIGLVEAGAKVTVGVTWPSETVASVHTIDGEPYPPPTDGSEESTEPTPTDPTESEEPAGTS